MLGGRAGYSEGREGENSHASCISPICLSTPACLLPPLLHPTSQSLPLCPAVVCHHALAARIDRSLQLPPHQPRRLRGVHSQLHLPTTSLTRPGVPTPRSSEDLSPPSLLHALGPLARSPPSPTLDSWSLHDAGKLLRSQRRRLLHPATKLRLLAILYLHGDIFPTPPNPVSR